MARRRAGLTQAGLCRSTGLSHSEIGLIERGLRTPRFATALRLIDALGISGDQLSEGIEWVPPRGGRPGSFVVVEPVPLE